MSNFSGAKFRKFSTRTEAINFIDEHEKSDFGQETQHAHMQESGENISQQLIMNSEDAAGTCEVTKLDTDALKQRLSVLQKRFGDSMEELRTEIDTVQERFETFCTEVNIPSQSKTGDEEFRALQECFSQLEKHYRDSVTELRAEISSLKLAVGALGREEEQTKTCSEKGVCTGSNCLSFKRNLTSVLEAVGPSTTAQRCVGFLCMYW